MSDKGKTFCDPPTTPAPEPASGRDWPEDASHENGNYECICIRCGHRFTGHKRRPLCKLCVAASAPTPPPDELVRRLLALSELAQEAMHGDGNQSKTRAAIVAEALILAPQAATALAARPTRQALFERGNFILHSGAKSAWKIECDALTVEDWAGLAAIAAERLPPFGDVIGIPRGGVAFAEALSMYVTVGCHTLLIADDVLTTGASMEAVRKDYPDAIGVVAFARNPAPDWIMPLWSAARPTAGEIDALNALGKRVLRSFNELDDLDDATVIECRAAGWLPPPPKEGA